MPHTQRAVYFAQLTMFVVEWEEDILTTVQEKITAMSTHKHIHTYLHYYIIIIIRMLVIEAAPPLPPPPPPPLFLSNVTACLWAFILKA